MENTTLRTRRTFVGLGTENKEEYERLVSEGKKHVVFTDRNNVPDSKTISGTQNLFQVQGEQPETLLLSNGRKYDLDLFDLQCSCTNCLHEPQKVTSCLYLNDQNWRKVKIEEKLSEQTGIDYSEFTVNELKDILRDRDLPVSGCKDELLERLQQDDQSDNTIVGNRGETTTNNKNNETDSEKEDILTNNEEEEL